MRCFELKFRAAVRGGTNARRGEDGWGVESRGSGFRVQGLGWV